MASPSSPETVLVAGATGKQGRAVVDALVASNRGYRILAITRSTSSAAAQALAQLPNTKLVQGDFNDAPGLFNNAGEKVDSAFLVTLMAGGGDAQLEERQGKAFIQAALDNDVKHLIFSSVNRHGFQPTAVPHFKSKHAIEEFLKEKAGDKMGWTILQPVAFMDNFTNDFIGKVFGAMWFGSLGATQKSLQLIATKDIGAMAAVALQNRAKYNQKTLALAGDELTWAEADAAFKEAAGIAAPRTFTFFGWATKKAMVEMGTMFDFFRDEGYNAPIAELRRDVYPGLMDLKTWIRQESAWARK